METRGLKIYGFWDGDFTFHHVDYEGLPVCATTFRVRIDNEDPEDRHRQNTRNPNQFLDHPHTIRPATGKEIVSWLDRFRFSYPRRHPDHTEALRHLRLHGPTHGPALRWRVRSAMIGLTSPITRVRDFKPEAVRFVREEGTLFSLTDEGLWLTSLMK